MSIVARTGFVGLVTNVACTQAPEGALQEAENVVLRRVACVEPRDGVKLIETTAGNPAAYGFSLDADDDVYCTYSGSAFTWYTVDGTTLTYADPVLGTVNPQPMRRDMFGNARLRGNVYVPYEAGVLRLNDVAFYKAGLPQYAYITGGISATGTWLLNNEQVAYRAVLKRTDANGVVVRSIPTGISTAANTSGAPLSAAVNITYDNAFNGLFDSVEVYRTRSISTTVTLDDEMQLVADIPASAFTLTAGFYVYTLDDLLAPTSRGATLYTSPSRGGILQQNESPPAAASIAAFKGSLFFGNVRGPQRTIFTLTWRGNVTGSATGVGLRASTGDFTNGSVTVLNVAPTTGLEKGMVMSGLSVGTLGTYITNIVGTTVTLSSPATATAVGDAVIFYDSIKVDGVWLAAYRPITDLILLGTGKMVGTLITPSKTLASQTYNIETVSRATGSETILATHGSLYDPPLPTYSGTPKAFDQDVWPGGIMWTKKDEPEHVTPVSYAFVGDKGKAILGLVPTRDALFILKEDGIFRLTGAGATAGIAAPWRIDPYDPTTRCLLPSSVKPLNGRAYFLSNKGVIAFGDGGPETVSLPIYDQVRAMIDQVTANFLSTSFYELNGVVGSTAAVFERENEYTLMRSSTANMLVYNENTRAWTTWKYNAHSSESLANKAVFNFEREGRVCYALGSTSIYGTRLSTDSQLGTLTLPAANDRETAVTASSYSAGTGLVTLSAPVSALADDVIQDASGQLWRVTANTTASVTVPVTGPTITFATGSCVLYRSLRCSVAPQTFYGAPHLAKRCDDLTAMFSRIEGPVYLRYAYSSQLTTLVYASWTEEDAVLPLTSGYASHSSGLAYVQNVPNAHSRSWLVNVAIRWAMTHGYARLEAAYLAATEMAQSSQQQVAG